MPLYRIYRVDADGHILAPAFALNLETERAAVDEALTRVGVLAVELWQGTHLIRRFEPVDERPLPDSVAR